MLRDKNPAEEFKKRMAEIHYNGIEKVTKRFP